MLCLESYPGLARAWRGHIAAPCLGFPTCCLAGNSRPSHGGVAWIWTSQARTLGALIRGKGSGVAGSGVHTHAHVSAFVGAGTSTFKLLYHVPPFVPKGMSICVWGALTLTHPHLAPHQPQQAAHAPSPPPTDTDQGFVMLVGLEEYTTTPLVPRGLSYSPFSTIFYIWGNVILQR